MKAAFFIVSVLLIMTCAYAKYYSISVTNNSPIVAAAIIVYTTSDNNNNFNKTGDISPGMTKQLEIPEEATDIYLHIYQYTYGDDSRRKDRIYYDLFESPEEDVCFEITRATGEEKYKQISC